MTHGRRRARTVTGLHIVSKQLTTGTRWFVYAWRGGPCLHKSDGDAKPVITREILDAQYHAKQDVIGRISEDIDWLIKGYEASPKFLNTKPSTKRDYRFWLTRISGRFGATPVEAFADWRMRGDVIEWRDGGAHQPRTAHMAIVMMVTLLNWGVENGRLQRHFCHGITLLHSVDKSEQIWEDRHWQAIANLGTFPAHVMTALRLARLTGLRLGDLVALEWSQVFEKQITVERTRKRGGRAVIPIFPELRALLDEIGRKDGAVLLNSRGKP